MQFVIRDGGYRFYIADFFTALSKRDGWFYLFGESVCVFADKYFEPVDLLGYL